MADGRAQRSRLKRKDREEEIGRGLGIGTRLGCSYACGNKQTRGLQKCGAIHKVILSAGQHGLYCARKV